MNIKTCSCGHSLTTFNSVHLGQGIGLDMWNCPLCDSTVSTLIGTIDLKKIPASLLAIAKVLKEERQKSH